MPLPSSLAGETWTNKTARIIFPWLIYAAQRGGEVTYGELDKEIVARGIKERTSAQVYSRPLGCVGDALQEIAEALKMDPVPPTNALVVNDTTRIPGDGVDTYVESFYSGKVVWGTLNTDEKLELTSELHEQIFAYQNWDKVEGYFKDVLDTYPELMSFEGPFLTVDWDTQKKDGYDTLNPYFVPEKPHGGGGESDDHYQLKMFVKNNPEVIGLSKSAVGKAEHAFGSGDTVDIEFRDGNQCVEVEIKGKNASDLEVLRGVWQCIKYLHLAKTQQKLDRLESGAKTIRPVRVLLVVGRKMPGRAKRHAKILDIEYKEVIRP